MELVKEQDYKSHYDETFSKITANKGSFYMCKVESKRFDLWFNECLSKSKILYILKADKVTPEYKGHKDYYNLYLFTDYSFNSRKAKLLKGTLVLLIAREVEYIPRMVVNIIPKNVWVLLKISVKDRARISGVKFVFNGFGLIFFMFKKDFYVYDIKTNKSVKYIDSKQVTMFEKSLIDSHKIGFFESYVIKNLVN